MKFTYEDSKEDAYCLAYIDVDGDLWFRRGECSGVYINSETADVTKTLYFKPKDAKHKFYKGDKLEITF